MDTYIHIHTDLYTRSAILKSLGTFRQTTVVYMTIFGCLSTSQIMNMIALL